MLLGQFAFTALFRKAARYNIERSAFGAYCGRIFWVLFQMSKGAWIGGGDVKLGILAGILLARPALAFCTYLLPRYSGLIVSAPLMARKNIKETHVPFGPF